MLIVILIRINEIFVFVIYYIVFERCDFCQKKTFKKIKITVTINILQIGNISWNKYNKKTKEQNDMEIRNAQVDINQLSFSTLKSLKIKYYFYLKKYWTQCSPFEKKTLLCTISLVTVRKLYFKTHMKYRFCTSGIIMLTWISFVGLEWYF